MNFIKKHVLILLLTVVVLTLLVAGCATSKRAELIENRLGANELKLKITEEKAEQERIKLAELKGLNQGLAQRVDGLEKADVNLKADIGATKNFISLVAQRLENTEADLDAKIQGLNKRVISVESDLSATKDQIAKEYKNLRSFALARTEMVRKRVAEREAKHVFAKDSVEDLSKDLIMFFVGPFPTGKATLTKGLEFQLEKVLAQVKNKKLEIIEIDAFASITGSPKETPETNQALSEERGKVVAEFLKTKAGIKIAPEKILALGGTTRFGEPLDNQSVVVFVKPAAPPAPAVPAPAPAPAPVQSSPTKP